MTADEQALMASTANGHKSLSMSPSVKELASALIKAQAGMPRLAKDKTNPFFKSAYVGLDTVMPAALKVLSEHSLGVVQTIGQDERGGTTLSTTLLHESGEWISDTQPLLLVKPDPQGQGSAVTYARRYAMMALLGMVAEEDDDGNRASSPAHKAPQKPSQRPQPPAPAREASDPREGAPGGAITQPQIGAIRAMLNKAYPNDEQEQAAWMERTCPDGVKGTNISLSDLTKGQASNVITELNALCAAVD